MPQATDALLTDQICQAEPCTALSPWYTDVTILIFTVLSLVVRVIV